MREIDSRGDFADETGYSPFPGNGNILSFRLDLYLKVLNYSKGLVPEFVNPKYKVCIMNNKKRKEKKRKEKKRKI